ncbi:MAG: sigma-70 family RNA polymerase sigma factor [Planctomycetes bacterium]|nr:sigma-70 family RNA polymerase sigma factor [Planctomycetota bacterium]
MRDTTLGGQSGDFQSTLWTVVLKAKDKREEALNALFATYWKPIYFYVRRKGKSIEDAKDLTQGFFVHFFESDLLDRVERGRGRFKSYLLATLEHFLANEYRKAHALKRGKPPVALDVELLEDELQGDESPEKHFRRAWGMAVLQRAMEQLKAELGSKWEPVRKHLSPQDRPSYKDTAQELGCSVTDVTNLLHRARKSLKEKIIGELRQTVETEEELQEELREFFEGF